MAQQGQVTKIYELRTLGYDDIHKELQSISKDFEAIKKAKADAEATLASQNNTDGIKQYREEVAKLKVEEGNLRVQRQQMINEAKAAQIQRQQEIADQKLVAKNTEAAAGSYNELYQQWKQLYALVKAAPKNSSITFQGQTLGYDQAIVKLKSLATAEQDFRRQFSQDGLLVAEYSSGIVKAFKQMGLGDIVGGQITKAQQRLSLLNGDFEKLKSEFQTAKTTGVGDLDAIEQKMVANRKEAVGLSNSVVQLQKDFRGTGDIGNQITTSISNGFKNIRGQVAGFLLGYLGIQAVLSKLSTFGKGAEEEFSKAEISTERLKASLENLGRSNELEPLSKTIEELSTKFKFLNENDLREATDKVVVFGKLTQSQIQQLLPVIIDFATRQKISLQDSAEVILKAVDGNAKALKGYGLNLKEASSETGKFDVIVNELGQKIKGTAEEFDKTTTGAQARNTEGWVKIREEVGKRLIPSLTALGTVVLTVVSFLLQIPWPIVVAGVTAFTVAMTRNYIITSIATQQGLIYSAYLVVQQIRTQAVALATRLATVEITLFNGAIRFSPVGAFLSLIGLLIPSVALFGINLKKARQEQDASNAVNREASKIYVDQISKIDAWIAIIKSAATSADTKKKAVLELTAANAAFSNVIKNNVIDLNELDKAYGKVTQSIELQAKTQASAKLTAEKEQNVVQVSAVRQRIEAALATGQKEINDLTSSDKEVLAGLKVTSVQGGDIQFPQITENKFRSLSTFSSKQVLDALKEKEDAAIQEFQNYKTIQDKADADLEKYLGQNTTQAADFEVDIKNLRLKIENLDKEIQDFQGTAADYKAKVAERNKLQEQLNKLDVTFKATPKPKASELTAGQKDSEKDIESFRDQLNAEDEKRRVQNEIDEETYLDLIYANNVNALNQKLKLLTGKNAEERKLIAEYNLEKVKLEDDTNTKIFELRKKALTDQLDITVKNAEEAAKKIIDDPTASPDKKAQAQLDLDKILLNAQIKFNGDMDLLEKNRNNISKKNAEDRDRQARIDQAKLNSDTLNTFLQAQNANEQNVLDAASVRFQQQINDVYHDTNLTIDEQKNKIDSLTKEYQKQTENIKISALKTQIQPFILLASLGLPIPDDVKKLLEQYWQIVNEQNTKAAADAKAKQDSKFSFKNVLKGLGLNTDPLAGKSPDDQVLSAEKFAADSLNKAYQSAAKTIDGFYNLYFQQQQQSIDKEKDLAIAVLESEKAQVEAHAQSQAEKDSLDRQYAAKEDAINKQAAEKKKKLSLVQATVSYATGLIQAWAAAAPYLVNPLTAPIEWPAIIATTAALTAEYFLQRAQINSAQYGFGGQPGEVPSQGGEFGGNSHAHGGTDFQFNGRNYNAEAKELAIIRTRNAPSNKVFTVSGTQMQMASAINKIGGGVNFKPGASISKFDTGGYLGETLQAPIFTPSANTTILQSGLSTEHINEMMSELKNMYSAVNNRIDKIQVLQVTDTVTDAQKKRVRQSSIGTLP